LLVTRVRFVFSASMNDLHLGSGGPPGQYGSAAGWRAATRVLHSCQVLAAVCTSTLSDLANTLLPSDCRTCGAPILALGKVRVCEDCVARVDPVETSEQEILCSRCGDALGMESLRFGASLGLTECTMCRLAPPAFSRAVAFATYDHEMREMLHLLKFDGRRQLAEHVLGRRMAETVRRLRPQASSSLVVIPVPLFAARQRERGYNQSLLLAQAAVKRLRKLEPAWSLHIQPRVLSRVKDTASMYALNPSQRRRNLQGAFRVLDAPAIRGQEVLLIDDILTTGATARECSRVLLAAGAAKVWVATAARAQPELSPRQAHPQSVARWDAPSTSPRTLEPDANKRITFH
jgi:ComF family protein